jgi:hypothetical protein
MWPTEASYATCIFQSTQAEEADVCTALLNAAKMEVNQLQNLDDIICKLFMSHLPPKHDYVCSAYQVSQGC